MDWEGQVSFFEGLKSCPVCGSDKVPMKPPHSYYMSKFNCGFGVWYRFGILTPHGLCETSSTEAYRKLRAEFGEA